MLLFYLQLILSVPNGVIDAKYYRQMEQMHSGERPMDFIVWIDRDSRDIKLTNLYSTLSTRTIVKGKFYR